MKINIIKSPITIITIPFVGILIYLLYLYWSAFYNFPKLDELHYTQGRQADTFSFSRYKGGCSLKFTINSEARRVVGVINSKRQCQELKKLDGLYMGTVEAWLAPGKGSDRPLKAHQLKSGSRPLWPYQTAINDARNNARREVITYLSVLLFTALIFAPAILALITALSEEDSTQEESASK